MTKSLGANHSASVDTAASTNQSTTTAQMTETTTEPSQNQGADFQREIDEMWGIPHEEAEEEAEETAVDESDEPEEEIAEEPIDGEETAEEEPADEPEEETAEEPQEQQPSTLRVNYLGKIYDLPEDKARKYAQIGMNAGRLQSQYEALKPLEGMREVIETLAEFQGQTPEEIIKNFGSMSGLRNSEVAALVEQGHDKVLAEELFDAKWSEAKQKRALEKQKSPQEKGLTQYQKEQIEQFAKFRPKEHENVTAGKPLPEDVLQAWKSGTDLTTAWLLHENKGISSKMGEVKKQTDALKKERDKLKKENEKLHKNAENRKKAPTSKKGTGGGTGSTDIYAGWNKF